MTRHCEFDSSLSGGAVGGKAHVTQADVDGYVARSLARSLHSELYDNGSEWLMAGMDYALPGATQRQINRAVDKLVAKLRKMGERP